MNTPEKVASVYSEALRERLETKLATSFCVPEMPPGYLEAFEKTAYIGVSIPLSAFMPTPVDRMSDYALHREQERMAEPPSVAGRMVAGGILGGIAGFAASHAAPYPRHPRSLVGMGLRVGGVAAGALGTKALAKKQHESHQGRIAEEQAARAAYRAKHASYEIPGLPASYVEALEKQAVFSAVGGAVLQGAKKLVSKGVGKVLPHLTTKAQGGMLGKVHKGLETAEKHKGLIGGATLAAGAGTTAVGGAVAHKMLSPRRRGMR